jgi:hypothetical protein
MSRQPEDSADIGLIDFARLVIDALEAAGAEYMLAGALAVAAWAEARSTQDVDLVISIPFEHIQHLSDELERRGMLVPADIIINIDLETRADLPINAIHLYSGLKAELFLMRPDDEYRLVAFQRRRRVDLGEPLGTVYVHAPEDLILYKLLYFQLSRQCKHIRDIASIWSAQEGRLDRAYMQHWAERLGVTAVWQEAQGQLTSRQP